MTSFFTRLPFFLFYLSLNFSLFAQVTTAEIRGKVSEVAADSSNNKVAQSLITAVHTPTGTIYSALTFSDGTFVLSNLKTGGPYTIELSTPGHKNQLINDITLGLDEVKFVNFDLAISAKVIEEVQVVSQRKIADSKKGGTGKTIDKETIENLPSLNRSLSDVTKLTPQSSGNSFGGSNYRYNNLNIDGTGANDAFGFQEPASGAGGSTASGTPGALAKTQPISLDAIEQLQVNISPYDVRLGNFTGASINAVTRSGTNTTQASVYFFNRNQYTTGRSIDSEKTRLGKYNDFQTGFRLGGALKKDKLFYFFNAEITNRIESVGNAPGSSTSNFYFSEMQALKDTLFKRYNYDAGTITNATIRNNSTKVFARLDWNINPKNQALIRVNFVEGFAENLERTPTILNFGGQGFRHTSKSFNIVGELKSKLSNQWNNKLILGIGSVQDKRDPEGSVIFPHIEITNNTTNTIFAGSYREAAVFQMKQKNFELTDNLVFNRNKHTVTLGTHVEVFQFNYHFVTPYNGRWAYRSLADFYANKPSRIRGTYNLDDNSYENNYENPSATFQAVLPSVYAQHDVKFTPFFKLTYGVRLEANIFPQDPQLVSSFQQTAKFTDVRSGVRDQVNVSPRLGFTYDILKNKTIRIKSFMRVVATFQTITARGGTGIFVGRMPFAWMAYSHIYNGTKYGNIDVRPTTAINLITQNFEQLATLSTKQNEINIVDKNYKLPQVWRSNLGLDFKTRTNYLFTIEGLFSKTIADALFQTINAKDSTVVLQGADNRPVFATTAPIGKENQNYTNVFKLTNTKKGFRYSVSVSAAKEFKFGLSVFTAYNFGVSKDVMNGVRVSPQANWEWNQTILANDPKLSYSNFDIRHRTITNISYTMKWKKVVEKSMFSLIFNGQSGNPYSYVYSGDLNKDGSPNNDLLFVPNTQADINLVDIKDAGGNVISSASQQWQNLDNYISSNKYLNSRRGKYTERNGGRTPWNYQMDIRLTNQFKLGKKSKQNLQVMIDIINFTNLLNRTWGRQLFVPNTTNAGYSAITVKNVSSSGLATYNFNNPTSTPWQADPIASRWQLQIGLRYNF
jgi:Fe-S cluster biosynthesis and repair protein YggX